MPKRKALAPDLVSFMTYKLVQPNALVNENQIIERIKHLNFNQAIMSLAHLNMMLAGFWNNFDYNFQIRLAKCLIPEDIINRIEVKQRSGKLEETFVYFHRFQNLYLMKLCFLYCCCSNRLSPMKFRRNLGISLLIVNDILPVNNSKTIEKANDEQSMKMILNEFIASGDIDIIPDMLPSIARSRKIWKEIFPRLLGYKYKEIEIMFYEKMGISLEEYRYVIFAILAMYHKRKDELLNDPKLIIFNPNDLIANICKKEIKDKMIKTLDLISLSINDYKYNIKTSKDSIIKNSFLSFARYPIAKLDEYGNYILLDFNYLLEKIGSGLFWVINDLLPAGKKDNWHSNWGMIFEEYVRFLIDDSGVMNRVRVLIKPRYMTLSDEASDVIIVDNENMMIIESKFAILRQDAKYTQDQRIFENEIKTKFERNSKGEWKGYGQLANVINKVFSKDSEKDIDDLDKTKIRNIFPILIVYEELFRFPFINYILNESFKKLLNNDKFSEVLKIWPLTIMTIEEFEIFIYLKDINLFEIISKRLSNTRAIYFSISNYLNYVYNNIEPAEWVKKEFILFGEDAKTYFFGQKNENEDVI